MTNELGNFEKPRKRRGWPEKRRQMQSEINRRTRPWEKSTGPRTEAGLAAAAQNALKHGLRGREIAELRRVLRLQREFMRAHVDLRAGLYRLPPQ